MIYNNNVISGQRGLLSAHFIALEENVLFRLLFQTSIPSTIIRFWNKEKMEGKKVTEREVNKVVFILRGSLGQSLRLQVLTNSENIIDNLNRDFDHLLPEKTYSSL